MNTINKFYGSYHHNSDSYDNLTNLIGEIKTEHNISSKAVLTKVSFLYDSTYNDLSNTDNQIIIRFQNDDETTNSIDWKCLINPVFEIQNISLTQLFIDVPSQMRDRVFITYTLEEVQQ